MKHQKRLETKTGKKNAKLTKLEALSAGGDAWEHGELGMSVDHAKVASPKDEADLDEALGLRLISIRLSGRLIEKLKNLAALDEIAYQPLIRRVLENYVSDNEFKLQSIPRTHKEIQAVIEERDRLRRRVNEIDSLSNAVTEFGSDVKQLRSALEKAVRKLGRK